MKKASKIPREIIPLQDAPDDIVTATSSKGSCAGDVDASIITITLSFTSSQHQELRAYMQKKEIASVHDACMHLISEGLAKAASEVEVFEIGFPEYDAFMERAAQIELYGLRPYWPTPEDILQKGNQFSVKELALMFSWLMEMNPAPVTDDELSSYKAMKDYVYTHMRFVDEGADKEASSK